MSTFSITLLVTFAIIIICLSLLGISMLLTGKSRLRVGMCGRVPTKKRGKDSGCGNEYTCGLCGKGNDEQEEKDDRVHEK